jgi:hypothetical protein
MFPVTFFFYRGVPTGTVFHGPPSRVTIYCLDSRLGSKARVFGQKDTFWAQKRVQKSIFDQKTLLETSFLAKNQLFDQKQGPGPGFGAPDGHRAVHGGGPFSRNRVLIWIWDKIDFLGAPPPRPCPGLPARGPSQPAGLPAGPASRASRPYNPSRGRSPYRRPHTRLLQQTAPLQAPGLWAWPCSLKPCDLVIWYGMCSLAYP